MSISDVPTAVAALGKHPVYGLVGVAAIAVIALWPPVGLAVLILGSPFVPIAVGTGTNSDLNFPTLVVPLLALLWLLRLPRRGQLRRFVSRPFPVLVAFLAVATVSLCLANHPPWTFAFAVYDQPWYEQAQTAPLAAQLGQLALFALSACTFLLVADQVRSTRWLQGLTWLFLSIAGVVVADRLVPEVHRAAQGLFLGGADGSLFWTWLVSLAIAQAAFNRRLPPGLRIALAALVLATLYTGLTEGRDWLAGWIPPLIAAITCLWIGAPRIALSATLAGAAIASLELPRVVTLLVSGDNPYSLKTRIEAWRILFKLILANPVLGLGPANYYHDTILLPILGYNVRFSSHNNLVDIIAQTGALGFALFLWFLWQVGRLGWRLKDRVPPGFERAYVYGALGGLVGTFSACMLGDWFLPFVYNVGLKGFRASMLGWFFLGGLVALERITNQSWRANPRDMMTGKYPLTDDRRS
jgi:hypothetical protein